MIVMGLSWLKTRLLKTHNAIMGGIENLVGRPSRTATLEELEETLISADVGVKSAREISEGLKECLHKDISSVREHLKDCLYEALKGVESPFRPAPAPFVIMVLGVNGTGKTTTIGKLASYFRKQGKTVLIAAADTFRAAAIEQLEIWAERAGCPVVKHRHGADPAAVAFDAVKSAVAKRTDIVIIDTAGRIHTKTPLMEELKKIKKVVAKEIPAAPHENLLIVDASTGQNAINQARLFNEAVGVTGIVLTKLDGTAKGGIIVAIARELGIPIRFIGVGETLEDLKEFNAREFAEALV
jgi:fused signal recognition particle receptor